MRSGKKRGLLTAFVAAFLFAVGLGVGGMTHPANVIGFLDFTGEWRPALLGVMVGGISVYYVLHRQILKLHRPVFHDAFSMPTKKTPDARLLIGAAIFGVGWGLGGICPGPAVTSVAAGSEAFLIFLVALFAGFLAAPQPKPKAAQIALEVPPPR